MNFMDDFSAVSDDELERQVAEQRRATRIRASLILTVIQELQHRYRFAEPTVDNIARILSEGDASPEHIELMRRKMNRVTFT